MKASSSAASIVAATLFTFFIRPSFAQTPTPADLKQSPVAGDITQSLLDEKAWVANTLPGDWTDVSTNAARQSRQLRNPGPIFGHVPQQVLLFLENGKITRMDIIYLEAGDFFGYRKSTELARKKAAGEYVDEALLYKMQQAEDTEIKKKEPQFRKLFADLQKDLPVQIAALTNSPGKRIAVGSDNMLSSLVTEYTTPSLAVRLDLERDQLVSVSIQPKDGASRHNIVSTSGRRDSIKDNVKQMANGDVVIDNIPMFDQGERGYCAIGTLTMVTQYYGLNINIDQLAAKAGYKEGETKNANIAGLYQSVASEARLRIKTLEKFDSRDAMRILSTGKPIIVWRYFSRERDAFHTAFKARYQADPAQVLPNPRTDRADKLSWPAFENGGHASVITGFNKERGEILFTESWGEETRNRRMRAEEMEATCYVVYEFDP